MAKKTRQAKTSSRSVGVGMIGTKFMGRAHSNAWSSAGQFFDLPREIRMAAVAGRNAAETKSFAKQWGWGNASTDWREMLEDPEVDLVDVCTPNNLHAEMSIAALEAGKHVACEKPLAGTLEEARAMKKAAAKAARRKIKTFVWFNYRRVPAVAFAHQLVQKGRLGRLFHVRASYLQDWGHDDTPLVWRFDASQAGSGAHGDLNATSSTPHDSSPVMRFPRWWDRSRKPSSIIETSLGVREQPSVGARVGEAEKPNPPWTTACSSLPGSRVGR